MANDGDFMDQVFATVQLPPVKYIGGETHTSESHVEKSFSSSQVVVTSEEHVHSESVVVTHSHSEQHTVIQNGEEYHESVIQSNGSFHGSTHSAIEHSEHYGSDNGDDIINQVFIKPVTTSTFRVENGILESDTDSRATHEDGDKKEELLSSVPQKTKEHDSVINELKTIQHNRSSSESSSSSSSSSSSTSSDSTLKDETAQHTEIHRTIEIGHESDDSDEPPNYDAPPVPEDHHYDAPPAQNHYEVPPTQTFYSAPPPEPEADYDSDEDVSPAVHNYHTESTLIRQSEINGGNAIQRDEHSRTSSVSSQQSKASKASKASTASKASKASTASKASKASTASKASRASRASSTSTLVSQREVPIVVRHKAQEPDHNLEYEEFENQQSVGELKSFYTSRITSEGKGIYKIREYGTGRRSGTNSERSSVSENVEPNRRYDTEHVIIESREKVVQKPPQRNLHSAPTVPGEIDEQPIESVGKLQALFGGPAPATTYIHGTHKLAKRGSNASTNSRVSRSTANSEKNGNTKHVHSKSTHQRTEVPQYNQVSNHHQKHHHSHHENHRSGQQYGSRKSVASSVTSDSRRSSVTSTASNASVIDTSKFSDVGKYDSIRVVKNVRSYKEFLDVSSQKELEEAARQRGNGQVKANPIPRPRYSISARSSYSKATAENSHIRPSQKSSEHYTPGKLDKATSCQTLIDIAEQKKRVVDTIFEEDEYEEDYRHSHSKLNGGSRKSKAVREGAHGVIRPEYDESNVNISKLKAIFEQGDKSKASSRRSSRSSVSSIRNVAKGSYNQSHHRDDRQTHSRRYRIEQDDRHNDESNYGQRHHHERHQRDSYQHNGSHKGHVHDYDEEQDEDSHHDTSQYSDEADKSSARRNQPIVTTVARVYFQ